MVVSVPSKLDPSLAPEGYHVIHAYGAGNEPYDLWKEFEGKTNTEAYKAFKEERANEYERVQKLPLFRRNVFAYEEFEMICCFSEVSHCCISQV